MSTYQQVASLVSDTFLLAAVRIGGMASGMLMTVILTRTLSADEYGQIAMSISVAMLGALACSLNIGAAAIRFVPRYRSDKRYGALSAYFTTTLRTVMIGGVLLWLVLLLAWILLPGPESSVSYAILFSLAAVPLLALLRVESAFIQALGYVIRAALPSMLVRPVLLCVLVVSTTYLSLDLNADRVMAMFCISAGLAVLLQFVLSRQIPERSASATETVPTDDRRKWFTTGFELLIPVLFLEFTIDTIVLISSLVLSPSDVAVLGVVLRIQSIIVFGVTSINIAAAPKLARAHSDGDILQRQRLIKMSGYLKLFPSALVWIFLYVAGDWLLSLFGAHYENYRTTLLIFSLTPIVLAVFGPTVLFMTILELQSHARSVFIIALTGLALSIILLGSVFGLNGIAVAVLLTWCAWNYALHSRVLSSAGFSTALFSWPADTTAARS